MRKVVLAFVLLFFVACAHRTALVEPKLAPLAEEEHQVFIPKIDCSQNPDGCDREAAEAVPLVEAPSPAAAMAMPAGAFLSEIGARAKKVRTNQKTWRDMGSADKPLSKITPAQIASVVETEVKPIFIKPNASAPPPVEKINVQTLVQYIAVSVALAIAALLWRTIKKKK